MQVEKSAENVSDDVRAGNAHYAFMSASVVVNL